MRTAFILNAVLLAVWLTAACTPSRPEPADPFVNTDRVSLDRYLELPAPVLAETLKGLQAAESAAAQQLKAAQAEQAVADGAYRDASDDKRPEALVRQLNAQAAARKAEEEYRKAQQELFACREAYVRVMSKE